MAEMFTFGAPTFSVRLPVTDALLATGEESSARLTSLWLTVARPALKVFVAAGASATPVGLALPKKPAILLPRRRQALPTNAGEVGGDMASRKKAADTFRRGDVEEVDDKASDLLNSDDAVEHSLNALSMSANAPTTTAPSPAKTRCTKPRPSSPAALTSVFARSPNFPEKEPKNESPPCSVVMMSSMARKTTQAGAHRESRCCGDDETLQETEQGQRRDVDQTCENTEARGDRAVRCDCRQRAEAEGNQRQRAIEQLHQQRPSPASPQQL
jgi:hypothetical protein